MIVGKSNEEWNKIVQEKDEQIKALYGRIKDNQTVSDAQQKLNGVLRSENNKLKEQLEKIEKDRLNAVRKAGFNE
jgi:regulator of replication initiation timing